MTSRVHRDTQGPVVHLDRPNRRSDDVVGLKSDLHLVTHVDDA
jgi:hypothetical protein